MKLRSSWLWGCSGMHGVKCWQYSTLTYVENMLLQPLNKYLSSSHSTCVTWIAKIKLSQQLYTCEKIRGKCLATVNSGLRLLNKPRFRLNSLFSPLGLKSHLKFIGQWNEIMMDLLYSGWVNFKRDFKLWNYSKIHAPLSVRSPIQEQFYRKWTRSSRYICWKKMSRYSALVNVLVACGNAL